MPVKIWDRNQESLSSVVETVRPASLRGEMFRVEAEALDWEIDRVLDMASALSVSVGTDTPEQAAFVRRWAIGRALADSGLLQSEYLEPQETQALWRAMARKCRLGVRADSTHEERWYNLIPARESDPRRAERDVFAVGLWLQEQELEQAMIAFGASRANAIDVHRRGSIRSRIFRDALARWFAGLAPPLRSQLGRRTNFTPLAKALAGRFPARGPGSAKRPEHYSEEDLYEEVRKVLDPLVVELVAEEVEPAPPSP